MKIFEDDRKDNINSIKPIYEIANFLGLVPPYVSNDKKKIMRYKLRAVIITGLLLVYYFYSLYCISLGLVTFSKTLSIVIYFTFSIAILQITLSILITAFWSYNEFLPFVLGFSEIEKYLSYNVAHRQKLSQTKLEMWVLHIILMFVFVTDLFVSIQVYTIRGYFEKLLLRQIEIYFNVTYVHVMYCFNLAIRYKFKKVNIMLKNCIRSYKKDLVSLSSVQTSLFEHHEFTNLNEVLKKVKQIQTLYNLTCKLVELYSKIFGWSIMFLVIHTGVVMLELICKELLASTNTGLHLKYLLFGTTNLMMGVIIAITCNQTTKEAKRTPTICYKFLLDVPAVSRNSIDIVLRKELLLLVQQTTHQCPSFSAAGFFKVNYTTLIGLIGAITSYVIVLIQINK